MRRATDGRREGDPPTPADAKARLVRTYAKKVRSDARWSRATDPWFCRMRERPNGVVVVVAISADLRLGADVEAEGTSRGDESVASGCHDDCRRIDRRTSWSESFEGRS
jgi:hypothetical protein